MPPANTHVVSHCREVHDSGLVDMLMTAYEAWARMSWTINEAVRNSPPPPMWLQMLGLVSGAPEGDLAGLGLTADELTVFNELKALGKDVQVIDPSQGSKTADFLVDGVRTEVKTLQSSGPNTLKNAIETAAKQGDQIIIDARKTTISASDAAAQAARAQGNIGGLAGRVTILTKDGPVKF